MSGVVTKILGVVMVLVLLVLMLCNVMVADQLQARRSIVAEVTNFIDEITDTGQLDERKLSDLYLACNAYGPVCDVKVTRYTRQVNPVTGKHGEYYTTYAVSTDMYNWNQGDLCKVTVEEVGFTSLSYFLYAVTGLSMAPVDFGLTGRIRT